jgi:hypothetical protein
MGVGFGAVRFTLGNLMGCDVLIGMDIITMGDFVVSNKGGVTVMSFRVPSSGNWDFVEEINRPNRAARRAKDQKRR